MSKTYTQHEVFEMMNNLSKQFSTMSYNALQMAWATCGDNNAFDILQTKANEDANASIMVLKAYNDFINQ